ncbi:hypothetical protein OIV83_005252 [Microbotryomycetes sp. JL201]|nr:hypothetical protein OIV83_005252 [Microbotryomycetes sp. JL201]
MPLPAWTIWGFDLSLLKFSNFGHKVAFDRRFYLRRQRVIAYQLAMLIGLAAECTCTYSLAKYEALRDNIGDMYEGATVHIGDIRSFQILLIIGAVFVATALGSEFFFMLQWPLYPWPRWYRRFIEAATVFIFGMVLAAAIGSTVVIATHSATITGVSDEVIREATALYFRPPLQYNKWAVNIAYVVLIWVTVPFVAVSVYLMNKAALHAEVYGPGPMGGNSLKSVRGPDGKVFQSALVTGNTMAEKSTTTASHASEKSNTPLERSANVV